MRILLVGDYPPPPGGIAIHVRQLHRMLHESGCEVRVLDKLEERQRREHREAADRAETKVLDEVASTRWESPEV